MPDYNASASNALASIKSAGRVLPIRREVAVVDKVTGEPGAPIVTEWQLTCLTLPRYKGVIFDSLDESFKKDLIRGRVKSILAAASGLTYTPEPLDIVTFDGSDWQVVGASTLAPGGIPILHTLGVRAV